MGKSLLSELPKVDEKLKGWPWTQESNFRQYQSNIEYPKISIITPSFNQGKFLEQTIRSVLLQNYPNLEYVIIDGGSHDNSINIIQKYEPWLTYWTSEKDDGQAQAINKGLQHCTGLVFNWLNSDDWYLPNVLEVIGRLFVQNFSVKVFCGQQIIQHADGTSILDRPSPIAKHLERTLSFTHINQPATFFHLPSFQTLLPLREDLHYLFDAEIWLRYLLKYGQDNVCNNKLIINYFRIHHSSKTHLKSADFNREKFYLLRALSLSCDAYYLMPNHTAQNKALEEELQAIFKKGQSQRLNSNLLKKNLLYRSFKERFGARDFEYCRSILNEIMFFRLHDWRFSLQKLNLLLPMKFVSKRKK